MSKKNVSAIVSAMGVLMTIISEILALVRQFGGQDEDIHRLATPEGRPVLEQIARLIVEAGRKVTGAVTFVLPSTLTLPSWAKGVAEGGDYEAAFAGQRVELELVEFLNQGDDFVGGEEMLRRSLAKTTPAGNRALEYLATHPELIPEEWRKFVLVFPGTVLLLERSGRGFQYLSFSRGQWNRDVGWLSGDFSSRCRVVGFGK